MLCDILQGQQAEIYAPSYAYQVGEAGASCQPANQGPYADESHSLDSVFGGYNRVV